MGDDPSILTGKSLQEYFRDLVGEAREKQRIEVAEGTEYYLVNLLSEYLDAGKLFVRDPDGNLREEPLALILKRALEGDREERVRALRRLGDTSLYVSGFFADHLEQKIVDEAYYIGMGHQAYAALARLLGDDRRARGTAGLYSELANKFTSLVDLLNEVSERVALTSQAGVLRVYERFLRTGSARMARLLAEQGVIPPLAGKVREVQ